MMVVDRLTEKWYLLVAQDLLKAFEVIEAIKNYQELVGAGGPVIQLAMWKLASEYLEGR